MWGWLSLCGSRCPSGRVRTAESHSSAAGTCRMALDSSRSPIASAHIVACYGIRGPSSGPCLPNKRLKLTGGDRSKGNGVLCPWRGTDCRPIPLRRRASRPQLKRDPLGNRPPSCWLGQHDENPAAEDDPPCHLTPGNVAHLYGRSTRTNQHCSNSVLRS